MCLIFWGEGAPGKMIETGAQTLLKETVTCSFSEFQNTMGFASRIRKSAYTSLGVIFSCPA